MSNKNELLIKEMEIYPLPNDIEKFILILTTSKDGRKFFIDIDKEDAEIIVYLKNKKITVKGRKISVDNSIKYLLFDAFSNILIENKIKTSKIVFSITPEKTFAKIFINKKNIFIPIKVGLILSLQLKTKLYITEDSFLFNQNPFQKEIEKYKDIRRYKFTISPFKKYSKEFLSFLLENSKQEKNFEMLYLLGEIFGKDYSALIDDKDFF